MRKKENRVISSTDNPVIKEYKKLLRSRRYRQSKAAIAVEGPNLVFEALKAGLIPQFVFYTREYYDQDGKARLDDLPSTVEQFILTPALFRALTDTETPRAVAAIFPFPLDAFTGPGAVPEKLNLVLVLDRLRDPGNLGAVIRTAAGAGVDRIYDTPASVDPYSPKVLRATAGAVFSHPVLPGGDPLLLLKKLKEQGLQVVAASAGAPLRYWSVDYRKPTALMIGNEAKGLAPALEAQADVRVSIPLTGKVESLNASVAAGIVLFEIIRQRCLIMP